MSGVPGPAPVLASRLEGTRRAVGRVRSAVLLCLGAAAFMALCGLMAAVDYLIEAPFAVRASWLGIVGIATLTTTGLLWWTWVRDFRVREAAAVIEDLRPALGQRLRTFLDYDDPVAKPSSASPALIAALTRDAEACTTSEDFEKASRQQPLGKSVALLCVVLACWGLGVAAGPECRTAAGRTFLMPWYYTYVEVSPLETTVVEGADATITINIAGRPVRRGFMRYQARKKGDEWTTVALTDAFREEHIDVTTASFNSARSSGTSSSDDSGKAANAKAESAGSGQSTSDRAAQQPLSGEYSLVIKNCRESLDFEVHAGPQKLPPGSIWVVQPLRVEKFSAHVEPPDYTGLPPVDVDTPQFKVPEGSRVSFELRLNRPIVESDGVIHAEAGLASVPADNSASEAAQKVIPFRAEERSIRGESLDMRQALTFDVRARAEDGMRLAPYRVQIRVQPDARPSVRFLKPAEELEVLATAEVPLAIEAGDDLGLHKVGIEFQVDGGSMQTLWEHNYAGESLQIQSRDVLALEDHEVRFPGSVNYFAFAEDNYFGEPRRTVTPLRFVDIRPFKRAYQLLDNGGT